MKTFIFNAKEGKMTWGSVYNHQRFLQSLKENEGKSYRIELLTHTRTLSQNALYRLFLEVIERETGQPSDDLHEWAKRKFLTPRVIKINGEEMKIPGTTTALDKIKFSEYLDKISAEVGIAVPDTDAYLREMDLAPKKDE
jgi:hypothetical protein